MLHVSKNYFSEVSIDFYLAFEGLHRKEAHPCLDYIEDIYFTIPLQNDKNPTGAMLSSDLKHDCCSWSHESLILTII